MKDTLETLIDKHSLETVLRALETICGEKAEHVATNWQDRPLANQWTEAATKCGLCADSVSTLAPGISR